MHMCAYVCMHLDVHVHMSKCICMCVLNPMVAAAAASSTVVLIVAMNVDLKIDLSQPQSFDARHLNAPACCFIALPTMDACKPNENSRPFVIPRNIWFWLYLNRCHSAMYQLTLTFVKYKWHAIHCQSLKKIKTNTLWTCSNTQSHLIN